MSNITGQDKHGAAETVGLIGTVASGSQADKGTPQGESPDSELEEVARSEREYVRRRLREELKREPTEEEMDEWLRQQTEGL